ncbi:permease-like cell division protein FtsX [Actinotignum urinale]|uniref:permease-like cell division protein FtsX n=1 Tax=Actinotignum urinale TaxID=190146 RepID=UPI000C7FF3F5|nr:permease-like cell division protein FtsX [Actinotignum urinale]WIK58705.1 permease-like cell division protein FtsX [Actinotignum urinale]
MRFRFVLSQTFKGLIHNKAMAVSVALVTFVSLLFVGAAALFQTQIGHLKSEWYNKVEVSVFMCATNDSAEPCAGVEATEQQIKDVRKALSTQPLAGQIESFEFETKQQAYENYKRQIGDSVWRDTVTADQMQVSYRIKLKDPEKYQVIVEDLSGRPGVQTVHDQREQVEPIFATLNRFTAIAGGLAAVMILTALMLIPTTIRLSAMSRETETGIMRYVGASNFFIELPFILEGIIASLAGAILASGGLWLGVHFLLEKWIGKSLPWIHVVSTGDLWSVVPWMIIVSIVVSGGASWIALRRYARV